MRYAILLLLLTSCGDQSEGDRIERARRAFVPMPPPKTTIELPPNFTEER